MIKQLGIYITSFLLVSVTGFYLHQVLITPFIDSPPFSLKSAYTFFGSFSLVLCMSFFGLFHTNKFKDQLGFLYLVSVALKIILFCVVFREHIFTQDSFTEQESINLLIPMVLMLILEVFFINKILKSASPLKNIK